jgi:hypothetical protein
MKYRMTIIDTHLQVLKTSHAPTPRCGRCNRILPFRWHGRLCSACSLGHVNPETRHDR